MITLSLQEDPRCNICGGSTFTRGPNNRLSGSGRPPRCSGCRSLERHRQLRQVYGRIPGRALRALEVLQLSADIGVDRRWFKRYEVSVFGGPNSLDVECIARDDASYDLVICNHVLEHVRRDRRGFRELLRIARPDGLVQITVPSPYTRARTTEFGRADSGAFGHWRGYGRDLLERFGTAAPGVGALTIEVFDPVTMGGGYVYFWSRDAAALRRIAGWMTPAADR